MAHLGRSRCQQAYKMTLYRKGAPCAQKMSSSRLTAEQVADVQERASALGAQHREYLEQHPEIKEILNDFLSDVLLKKPEDVFTHAQEFFSSLLKPATGVEPVMMNIKSAIPRPIVVCGPSGVGKGTLIEKLMKEFPDKFGFSVSHTTRDPRPGEQNGVHYHFTNRETMEPEINAGKFIEHAEVHGNFYGTSIAAVQSVLSAGKICVLDIDVQGARQVKKANMNPAPAFIFVRPPSLEELERRLRGRGTETEEKIKVRLGNAAAELEASREPGFFDHVLVNDDLEATYDEMKKLIFN